MVYERVENPAQFSENEGGTIGVKSKPVVDVTECHSSNSKLGINIMYRFQFKRIQTNANRFKRI